MGTVRPAAVAGMFYPADPQELASDVRDFLDKAAVSDAPVPKALITPHAGYIYSGAVAATAYKRILPARGTIKTVVLLGPCHRVAVQGLALSSADAFMTPLGPMPVDQTAVDRIRDLPQVQVFDATHTEEHSLEVHLPFLQVALGDVAIVPLVVGGASPNEVAQVLERLWGGPETLIVISSDLSHYLDYKTAQRVDEATCRAIEQFDIDGIGRNDACGRISVRGLLTLARKRGLSVETVDLRNSGDTAGSKDRVVGYGSWVFVEEGEGRRDAAGSQEQSGGGTDFEQQTRQLLDDHGPVLLHLAAASIENGLQTGKPLAVNPDDYAPDLKAPGACFVTLKKNGKLRGCIGSPQAHQPLIKDIADNAYSSAFRDNRFPNLTVGELPEIDLSLSVLSPQHPMTFSDQADFLAQLRPNIDGLVIEDQGRRALFLPSVWEQLTDKRMFVAHLKVKAGLSKDHWSESFRARRFITEEIASKNLPDADTFWSLGQKPV